jgi:hypothetical protein
MTKTPSSEDPAEALLRALVDALSEAEENPEGVALVPRAGLALKPGAETPLWNVLREQARRHLDSHGEQAKLARRLGLHRQAINAYFTQGTRLPDGERTLQILLWVLECEKSREE